MQDIFRRVFSSFSGGSILDVATAAGGFIPVLIENIPEIHEIIGIDTHEKVLERARKSFQDPRIHFEAMDVHQLRFPDASFDVVSIANSMHHLADLKMGLSEMLRVLKPGGWFVVFEMYRDGQSPSQMTHVLLHHWWAEIDDALGIPHNETFTRAELIRILRESKFSELRLVDYSGPDEDAFDPERLKYLDGVIDAYIQKSRSLGKFETINRRGTQLRLRLHDVGFRGAAHLLSAGKKT